MRDHTTYLVNAFFDMSVYVIQIKLKNETELQQNLFQALLTCNY